MPGENVGLHLSADGGQQVYNNLLKVLQGTELLTVAGKRMLSFAAQMDEAQKIIKFATKETTPFGVVTTKFVEQTGKIVDANGRAIKSFVKSGETLSATRLQYQDTTTSLKQYDSLFQSIARRHPAANIAMAKAQKEAARSAMETGLANVQLQNIMAKMRRGEYVVPPTASESHMRFVDSYQKLISQSDKIQQGVSKRARERRKEEERIAQQSVPLSKGEIKNALMMIDAKHRDTVETEKKNKAIIAGKTLERQFEYADIQRAKEAQRQRRLGQVATGVGGRIDAAFPIPVGADTRAITEFNMARQSVQEAVGRGDIKQREYLKAQRQLQSGQPISGVSNETARAALKVADAHGNLTKATENATRANQGFHRSMGDIIKQVFLYETLYRGVYALLYGIKDSLTAAAEFQVKIAEIMTIGQDAPRTFEQWGSSVIGLSDAFGSTSADVAEGVYQTISNQVAKGTEAINFMRDAQYLAAAAVSNTATSVNYLSSIINAFGMSSESAFSIAAKGFKTVELGRVRLNEMSDTIGRTSSMANALGVSFEEMNAAIASMTIQGVRFTEAQTGMTNIMMRLLKPNKALQDVLTNMGYPSGEALLAAMDWLDALIAIKKAGGENNKEIQESFNNMRGLRGVFLVTADGGKRYKEALAAQSTAGLYEQYMKAYDIVLDNSGKKMQIEINRVKNFFQYDLGQAHIETVSKLSGGFISLSEMIQGSTVATFGLLAVMTALKSANMFGEVSRLRGLSLAGKEGGITGGAAALGKLGGFVTGIGAAALGVEGVITAYSIYQNYQRKKMDEQRRGVEYTLNLAKTSQSAETDALKAAIDERSQIYLQYYSKIAQVQNKQKDETIKQVTLTNKQYEKAFESFINKLKDDIDDLSNSIKENYRTADDMRKKLIDLDISSEEKVFNRKMSMTDSITQKYKMAYAESQSLRQQSEKFIESGDTETGLKIIEKAKDRYSSIADETASNIKKLQDTIKDPKTKAQERLKAQRDLRDTERVFRAATQSEGAMTNSINMTLEKQRMVAIDRANAAKREKEAEEWLYKSTQELKTERDAAVADREKGPEAAADALKKNAEFGPKLSQMIEEAVQKGMPKNVAITLQQESGLLQASLDTVGRLDTLIYIEQQIQQQNERRIAMENIQKQGKEIATGVQEALGKAQATVGGHKLDVKEFYAQTPDSWKFWAQTIKQSEANINPQKSAQENFALFQNQMEKTWEYAKINLNQTPAPGQVLSDFEKWSIEFDKFYKMETDYIQALDALPRLNNLMDNLSREFNIYRTDSLPQLTRTTDAVEDLVKNGIALKQQLAQPPAYMKQALSSVTAPVTSVPWANTTGNYKGQGYGTPGTGGFFLHAAPYVAPQSVTLGPSFVPRVANYQGGITGSQPYKRPNYPTAVTVNMPAGSKPLSRADMVTMAQDVGDEWVRQALRGQTNFVQIRP